MVLVVAIAGCGDNRDDTVTCIDDGLFCNGIERLIGADCVPVPAAPCDDGAACTRDLCDEASKTCRHELMGAECETCQRVDCTPDCAGRVCGDDGCGGLCGTCGPALGCTPNGSCADATGAGTCAVPRPLAVMLGVRQILSGDTTTSVHQTVPTCNRASTAVEDVWSFTVTAPTGIEAQSSDYDTVLHLRREDPNTTASECLDDSAAVTVGCSDDSAPPGDYGSRIAVLLSPGTYYLSVDGFDATQFGPYTLQVKFVADCVPSCDGQFCDGDDGCGGTCGTCAAGLACGTDHRCREDPCVPDCLNGDGSPRTCGDDGCLGTCGTCTGDDLCVPSTGTCARFPTCDHEHPQCAPACQGQSYCGTDCACHGSQAPLPDLVINARRLADEVLFDHVNVTPSSCALAEQCVGGTGDRRVLRFSVEAINQGQATMTVPLPEDRPDMFSLSPCHGHYHFNGFASYALLDGAGNVVVEGRKQAYCMEDTIQVHEGPNVGCSKIYSCFNQGIQPGWSDLYGNTLDCQWLDITGIAPGAYQLQVTLNPGKAFHEVTFANNSTVVPVSIPADTAR